MLKAPGGWTLPLYLAEGTHTYKFTVDGEWIRDEANPDRLPDGEGGFNSVISIGHPRHFTLKGNSNAKQVILSGSFNNWREDELFMKKTVNGWELDYTLGPGNYEYRFKADEKWMPDPDNYLTTANGTSWLIIEPNYKFRLEGFDQAKAVYVSGDFNNWEPTAFPLKKVDNTWVFPAHLSIGKHVYKFIVDGKWIIDPANKLWEGTEYGTGNSVIWIEK